MHAHAPLVHATAAYVPIAACAACPLFNRFVAYGLVDSGTGVRRKAAGLTLIQMQRLCEDVGLCKGAGPAGRNAVQVRQAFFQGWWCLPGLAGAWLAHGRACD